MRYAQLYNEDVLSTLRERGGGDARAGTGDEGVECGEVGWEVHCSGGT